MQTEKVRWARLSIVSNALLVGLKIAAGLITGSVSILAEGIHSGSDLAASIITYISVRISGRAPDKSHPYGHGKFENAAGVIEGLFILAGAVYIIYEAVPKLVSGRGPETLGWGMAVMALSSAVNLGVSAKLFKVAEKTDSPALKADAWHLRTDVYTSAGVLCGLALIKLTGKPIFDPILALVVAVFIIKAGVRIISEGFSYMMDVSLPDDEMAGIRRTIERHGGDFVEFHMLRARKSGSQRFIDLHLVVPRGLEIGKAHDLCDIIEAEIGASLPDSSVTIHCEPCEKNCRTCSLNGKTDECRLIRAKIAKRS